MLFLLYKQVLLFYIVYNLDIHYILFFFLLIFRILLLVHNLYNFQLLFCNLYILNNDLLTCYFHIFLSYCIFHNSCKYHIFYLFLLLSKNFLFLFVCNLHLFQALLISVLHYNIHLTLFLFLTFQIDLRVYFFYFLLYNLFDT